MKKFFIMIIALVACIMQAADAQEIQSVSLKASGLTCSMCSKAIYKALQKTPAVAKVDADIEGSGYVVTFKPSAAINLDDLKNAVVNAGFSVASMEVKMLFPHTTVQNDTHVKVSNSVFHFIQVADATLQGEKNLLVLDKDFLPEKSRKKYAGLTSMPCFATGNMKAPSGQEERVYHVTVL